METEVQKNGLQRLQSRKNGFLRVLHRILGDGAVAVCGGVVVRE